MPKVVAPLSAQDHEVLRILREAGAQYDRYVALAQLASAPVIRSDSGDLAVYASGRPLGIVVRDSR